MVKTRREERGEVGLRSIFCPTCSLGLRSLRLMLLLIWRKIQQTAVYFIIVPLLFPTSSPFPIFLSADEDVTLAGFKEKFKTYVIVDSSGVNMWMSPASFKSSCDMVIRFYPFDRQTCHLTFGSLTFDNRLLKMMNKDDSHSTSGWNEKKLVLILMYR